jgi:hypothetical protein
MGQGEADTSAQMGMPAAPTPVVTPSKREKRAMSALPIMSHTEALAQPVRPWTFKDSTGVVRTIH